MSSIFSVESSDNFENAVLAVANSPLDSTSVAYGLGLNNQEAGLAIVPTIHDLSEPKATDTSNSGYLNSSDPLLTEFIENNSLSDRQITAPTDDLTGMGEGEALLLYASPSTASSTASTGSVSGRLSFADDLNPTRLNALKDDYSFSSQSTATVRLNLYSSSFDTYLQLVDALMLSANQNLTHAQVREILTGTASLSATAVTATVPQHQIANARRNVPASPLDRPAFASLSQPGLVAEGTATGQSPMLEAIEVPSLRQSERTDGAYTDDWQCRVPLVEEDLLMGAIA